MGKVNMHRSDHGLSADTSDWRQRKACKNAQAELFFPIGTRGAAVLNQTRQAKTVCNGCPVRTQCLNEALDAGIDDGIWGGLDEGERRRLRAGKYQLTYCVFCALPMVAGTPGQVRCRMCRPAAQRQPASQPDAPAKPADHHDRIVTMLTARPRPTWAAVAAAVGTTKWAVKSHWRRHLAKVEREQGAQARAALIGRPDDAEIVQEWERLRGQLTRQQIAARLNIDADFLNLIIGRARTAHDRQAVAA